MEPPCDTCHPTPAAEICMVSTFFFSFNRIITWYILKCIRYPSPQIEPWIPPYVERENESSTLKKARLLENIRMFHQLYLS